MSSTTSFNFNPSSTATSTATPSCITVTPDSNGYVPPSACNSNYLYYPNFGGAVFFAIAFGISLFFHIFQAFSFKKWRLCWVLIMGISWEFLSFCLRAAGAKNQQSSGLQISNQLLFLLAPIWINAFIYMVMGRMIFFFIPEQKIWGVKGVKIGKIFVWLDILSFLTQVAGGLLIQPQNDASTVLTGIHVYMGGIAFQETCILVFTSIAIKFMLMMQAREKTSAGNQILDSRPTKWRLLLYVLFASLVLITIRIIYRLVEWTGGMDPTKNPIPFSEAYSFVLDALPMMLACYALNAVHPGTVLQGEGSEFPARKVVRAEKKMKRGMKMLERAERRSRKNPEKWGPGPSQYYRKMELDEGEAVDSVVRAPGGLRLLDSSPFAALTLSAKKHFTAGTETTVPQLIVKRFWEALRRSG
ncbi:hypothetical protein G7Y89_g7791 [Cudoniella acicularis]|uniref:RTA1 domain-containing protein n=1 Tax=Cudoniella acicularis TaxID=354080 RepID=A0A8H4W3G5_9HELO|nr:hypothetical protein G7Y89_g7791 [Cudoniella acicularis]